MSHIVEFTVDGLAGRDEAYSQKLRRDVNIFFGPNGSGKTSLLKILHSAMSLNTAVLANVAFKTAEVKIYSANYDKVFTRSIKKNGEKTTTLTHVLPKTVPQQFIFHEGGEPWGRVILSSELPEWKTKPQKQSDTTTWHHQYLPTSRLWLSPLTSSLVASEAIRTEEELDSRFQTSLEALWRSYFGEILTKVRQAQEEGLANILKWILSSDTRRAKHKAEDLDAETAYKRVQSFLARQNSEGILGPLDSFSRRYKGALLKHVVNYIDEVEQRIEDAMSPRDKLQSLITSMFSGNKTVAFTEKSIEVKAEDKAKIGLASLSSGEKQVLRILVEALLADQSSIIVDEPEISMHVDWQRELISAMSSVSPNAQLIIATHSPEIMADIDDSKIFRI